MRTCSDPNCSAPCVRNDNGRWLSWCAEHRALYTRPTNPIDDKAFTAQFKYGEGYTPTVIHKMRNTRKLHDSDARSVAEWSGVNFNEE